MIKQDLIRAVFTKKVLTRFEAFSISGEGGNIDADESFKLKHEMTGDVKAISYYRGILSFIVGNRNKAYNIPIKDLI